MEGWVKVRIGGRDYSTDGKEGESGDRKRVGRGVERKHTADNMGGAWEAGKEEEQNMAKSRGRQEGRKGQIF